MCEVEDEWETKMVWTFVDVLLICKEVDDKLMEWRSMSLI